MPLVPVDVHKFENVCPHYSKNDSSILKLSCQMLISVLRGRLLQLLPHPQFPVADATGRAPAVRAGGHALSESRAAALGTRRTRRTGSDECGQLRSAAPAPVSTASGAGPGAGHCGKCVEAAA